MICTPWPHSQSHFLTIADHSDANMSLSQPSLSEADTAYAYTLHSALASPFSSAEVPIVVDGVSQRRSLMAQAAGRKRRRIEFFNSDRGISLRLKDSGHTPKHGPYYCCALYGQYRSLKGPNGKLWRGQRTTFSSLFCSVNLGVRVYSGLRESCWST